jgi:NAD(P)-dependent dehydrogenase (short-subunit alcohol dehydrogenase family)
VISAGIGYYTVKQLASRGAKVYLGARSESRAKAAIKRLLEETPSIPQENISWLRLDLSNQAQVVDAAVELRSKEQRLDILGNSCTEETRSEDHTNMVRSEQCGN